MKNDNELFNKIVHFIVYKGRGIEKFFFIATVICAVCFPFVKVNYDLSKYLPSFAPTKQALDVMEKEFGYPGMARIEVKNVSLQEAKSIQDKIADLDGVDMVTGPGTAADVYMGTGFLNDSLTDALSLDTFSLAKHYKDGNALLEVIFKKGDDDPGTRKAINQIYSIVGKDRGYFSGSAISSKEREAAIQREITIAIGIALVIIWLILTLTTTSWMEPFLFIFVMIIAIILNMGSNLMFGTISFFTFSTAAILQLAVSMDYSIFLQHTFTAYKKTGMEVHKAMECALKEAASSIFASAATTIVGFIVLVSMRFSIGRDVGFVLTKGILCSLFTVIFLMPALILHMDAKIVKTAHRPFLPPFDKFARAMHKIRKVVFVAAILVAVPCYFGQDMNKFYYGDDAIGSGPGTRVYEDSKAIDHDFGKSNTMIAIVPNGSIVKERALSDALQNLDFVNYSLSLSGTLPKGIPESFLPKDLRKELRSDHYARYLISMNTEQESQYAFDCSKKLTDVVKEYYPNNSYVLGMTPTTIDIRDILTKDYNNVSLLSLAGVALVVFLTFRSILVPILVIIPIEVAIYLNMTIPYLIGDSMVYIGYIIVSCLQLGATIDYSILMTNNYLGFRKTMKNTGADVAAISKSTLAIATSGGILVVVGYLLYFTSSIQAISQVGRLVGRGALLSVILVLSLLPALLSTFDKLIQKQQARADARRERRRARRNARRELKRQAKIQASPMKQLAGQGEPGEGPETPPPETAQSGTVQPETIQSQPEGDENHEGE